jgi:hypothetical protein
VLLFLLKPRESNSKEEERPMKKYSLIKALSSLTIEMEMVESSKVELLLLAIISAKARGLLPTYLTSRMTSRTKI